jgi:hypothetical protein
MHSNIYLIKNNRGLIDFIADIEAHVRSAFRADYTGEIDMDMLARDSNCKYETVKFIFKNGRVMSAFRMKIDERPWINLSLQ